MSQVTTQVDPDDSLRPLYEAARRVGYLSAATRTFEQWCEKVSDHELDDARRVIEIENRVVLEAAKAERVAAKDYNAHLILVNWRRFVHTRQARESAVDALIEFESQQK